MYWGENNGRSGVRATVAPPLNLIRAATQLEFIKPNLLVSS